MKLTTRFLLCAALCASALSALRAAPLAADTPVYSSPDTASTVIVTLAAGVEPQASTSPNALALPEGWHAVDVTSSQLVWVRDSELNKELDIKPGSELRAEPKTDSALLGTMVAGSVTELRNIQGKWVQMLVSKKTTGYINTSIKPAPAPAPTIATPPPATAQSRPAISVITTTTTAAIPSFGASPASATPAAAAADTTSMLYPPNPKTATATATTPATATETRPIPSGSIQQVKSSESSSDVLPRTFEGTFASTRRAFAPRRPYEFQLTGPDNVRYAYIDLTKILATAQFESYIGRTVVVYGVIAAVPGTSDIVIKAETLQLK